MLVILRILKQFNNILKHARLRITGAPFEAVGLPDCIQQGKNAIEEILEEL